MNTNTLKLLRIPFSLLLMPIFLLALSQCNDINLVNALTTFFIIHLLVYPASNGYNSYIDKDETSIGGLEKPPMPTKSLFYITLAMDGLAILLSYILISELFCSLILLYILASRAYSSKLIRLKKYPYLGFLIVVIFQGGFTFLMCSVGISKEVFVLSNTNILILLATSFQIAGAYPLTQVYQHEADKKDGVITLSYLLGYRGTFGFTAFMFLICNAFYFIYFTKIHAMQQFFVLQLLFIPILVYFAIWLTKVIKDENEANYKNTMQMNLIAACCMNVCFAILFLLNHT